MTRALYRFVEHTIRHEPAVGVTCELFCTAHDCGEESGSWNEQGTAQDWALRHTGLNPGHDLFRRVFTDHARVTRAE
ncbi:hypothetical protein [Streptomyces sp. NPDC090093]|uniref:DUF7848 domain-containing protein n=1 Tax=Streptomyces sp. NPDC090093 TaxID=3365945 RepID=UPI0037F718AE